MSVTRVHMLVRRGLSAGFLGAAWLAGLATMAPAADPPALGFPVDCTLGADCFVQFFVDREPGPDARDFRCGPQTYDAHNGTDIRLTDFAALARGVAVVAAAPGRVAALRDGEPDFAFMEGGHAPGRECGNGVVLDHGGGWRTQYCHLAPGSLRVTEGARVAKGMPLGAIGMSGLTEFPHLHFTLRQGDRVVDPFDARAAEDCGAAAEALWSAPMAPAQGGLLSLGLADRVPEWDAVKAGTVAPPPADPPALVLWAYFHGTRSGDVVEIALDGPGGRLVERAEPMERTQAQMFRAAGLRRPAAGWPPGEYRGSVALRRDGAVMAARDIALSLGR